MGYDLSSATRAMTLSEHLKATVADRPIPVDCRRLWLEYRA
jgi:hypothetical protein